MENENYVTVSVRGIEPTKVDRKKLGEDLKAFSEEAKRNGKRPGQPIQGISGEVSSDVLAAIFSVITTRL